MKIKAVILLLFLGLTKLGSAQRLDPYIIGKTNQPYLHIGYSIQDLKAGEARALKSDWGVHLTAGKTYFLTPTPIADLFEVGIDWSYVELNYNEYIEPIGDVDEWKINKFEAGMQVGPAVIFHLTNRIRLHGYFRYSPSYSGIYDDIREEYHGAFASYFAAGAKLHFFGKLGVGAEKRWGSSKFDITDTDLKETIKQQGPRIFISFGF